MTATQEAWDVFLTQAQPHLHPSPVSPPAFSTLPTLATSPCAQLAPTHFLDLLKATLRDTHIPAFWARFNHLGTIPEHECDQALETVLQDALHMLCSVVDCHCASLAHLTQGMLSQTSTPSPALLTLLTGLQSRYLRDVGSMLMTSAPIAFSEWLQHYYVVQLSSFACHVAHSGEDGTASRPAAGPTGRSSQEPWVLADAEVGAEWAAAIAGVSQQLRRLGLGSLNEEAYSMVVCGHLQAHLAAVTAGQLTRAVLPLASAYVERVAMRFLCLLLAEPGGPDRAALRQWSSRLDYYVYEAVGTARIGVLFELVVDYPDSRPALGDLTECMKHTHLQQRLVGSFRGAVQRRLLHAGASTRDIIQHYVDTIKMLQAVDPAGSLVGEVGGPIRAYLRGRPDCIRCVVTLLTEEPLGGGGSLLAELKLTADADAAAQDGDLEDDKAAWAAVEGWEPTPVELGATAAAATLHSQDIVAHLVGIYGEGDFVTQYRDMLAHRLLAQSGFNNQHEMETCELLKERFGESRLQSCEVMLRDLQDSRRLNKNVKNTPVPLPAAAADGSEVGVEGATPPVGGATDDLSGLTATIVSYLFWPDQDAQGERKAHAGLVLPAAILTRLDSYAARYAMLKRPRKLRWWHQQGVVDLTVHVSGVDHSFQVSPAQAAIIQLFEGQAMWTAPALSEAVGLPEATLRRKILLWVQSGVLREQRAEGDTVVYERATVLEQLQDVQEGDQGAEDDAPTLVLTEEQQTTAELKKYDNYIVGMLTNFKGLALERMHHLLRLFCIEPKYDKTQDQLAAYLQTMITAGRVVMEGATYRNKVEGGGI